MEGFKITENQFELSLDDEQNISKSYNRIRKEYCKKGKKYFITFIVVLTIILIHFGIINPIYLIPNAGTGISGLQLYKFPLSINWTILSASVYIIFYFVKLAFMRATPSLKDYISNEIYNLGFKLQEKKKSRILFFIMNSLSVLILILVELKIIHFNNSIIHTLFKSLFIIYLVMTSIIPILWRFYYDGLIVKLKANYQIFITPYFKLRKKNVEDQQLIGLYLTSNNIAVRFNNKNRTLYKRIVEDRWLPRKRRFTFSIFKANLFLKFYEFSTPLNFQKQFLNIILALQDWDMNVKTH